MPKRVFDLTIALIQLLLTVPILVITAVAIRLETPGPIWYRSPRIGVGGKEFGLYRFRTVAVDRPATLPSNRRLTIVGRWIRYYSLDDLLNWINVLRGELSIIGPRPMEPEQIDPADSLWQEILSVRPGLLSPAILQLGTTYNMSSIATKQQLEVAYVRHQSFWYDLQLCWRAIQRLIATKGNLKRGLPQLIRAKPKK